MRARLGSPERLPAAGDEEHPRVVSPAQGVFLDLTFEVKGQIHNRRLTSGSHTLGRDRGCDVVVPDSSVSRRHARLELQGGRWILTDQGSANGVLVGGRLVRRHEIVDGDTVELGNVLVRCRLASGARPSTPADLDTTEGMSVHTCNIDELLKSVYEPEPARQPGQGGVSRDSHVLSPRPTAAMAQRPAWILQLLRDASDALLANDDLKRTLEVVMDLVFDHLPADRGQILLVDPDSNRLETAVRRYRPEAAGDGLNISRHIAQETIQSRRAVLVQDTSSSDYEGIESIVTNDIRSAMCAPLCHKDHVLGLIWLDRTSDRAAADSVFEKTHLELLSILASLAAAAVERAQLRDSVEAERRARERLSRYHAPAVVEQIVRRTQQGLELETEERVITVLFCDIVSFTAMSEHLPPKEVTEVLNRVFQALTEEVFAEVGTLDKFIGDAMMVFFGAPTAQPDHAARAVRAALAMQRRLADLNASDSSLPRLGIRIGINTGPAIVGDVGAEQRRDYTVIGDTVNVASRLETSVAQAGEVVIGEATYAEVASQFDCEPLGEMCLKGKQNAITAYLVRG